MSETGPGYEIRPFPLARRAIIDSGRIARRKHTISALVEVDVTGARQIIQAHREKTDEAISFTAFILACLGQAVDRNRYIHARRDMWGRLVLFDEVDCTTMIEIDLEGHKFPLAHIMRAINQRSVRSIHEEIRAIQADPRKSASLQQGTPLLAAFLLLPTPIRLLVYGLMGRSPRLFKRQFGTMLMTAVGMFGVGSGWGLGGGSIYATAVMLGGIGEKPGVVNGQIAVREFLSLSVQFDHDIVDGAPAARFVARFKELIESAYGLDEYT